MIKSKGIEYQTLIYSYWAPTGTVGNFPYQALGNYSRIAYEQPLFKRFGDCLNTKTNVKDHNTVLYGILNDRSNAVYAWTFWSNYDFLHPVADQADEGFNSRAFQAMKPSINLAIQAPLEIKELISGWKELLKPFKLGSSALSKAGSTNLWYSFGVAPTIGSIRDTIDALKTFEQRLNTFLALQGKELTSHYNEIQEISGDTIQMGNALTSKYPWQVRYRNDDYKITRTATMVYKYSIPKAKTLKYDTLKLLAMADMFGVSAGVSMLWEATPFSFVVDWFLNVGDFLEQFDKPFLDTDVEVIDYCISTKAVRTTYIDMWRSSSLWQTGFTVTQNHYQRTRCLPDYTLFGIRESGNFGTKQFLLGLSLMVS